ncbi:MAG: DUF262 domain-containing HNH endonuclease family protein [Candidatus Methanomethylophilaceae archaeon]|nr:DUF262 domain-containing HNH endonuclease family protein [Candidatus Cloacimonadota bacterium]MDY0225167.1 DUF262 domain-containing HNH endonuclease family protein [Candidatus Methanomethylophilaceae archaeon]
MGIISSPKSSIGNVFDARGENQYHIPKYQREYSWSKKDWDALFDDIMSSQEHFIGSIITMAHPENNDKGSTIKKFDIIDGQQRLVTISILMCAIYSKINGGSISIEDESSMQSYLQLKKAIVLNKDPFSPRIHLQTQGNNVLIYQQLLNDIGFENESKYKNAGNCLIYSCFRHFRKRIDEYLAYPDTNPDSNRALLDLYNKICTLCLIDVTVSDLSDALEIFGTLNNTGVPLTAVDLIKMTVLKEKQDSIDDSYSKWTALIDNVRVEDDRVTDRFFRQYMNAFKYSYKQKYGHTFDPVVTSSNVYGNYEWMLTKSGKIDDFLGELYASGKDYSKLITNTSFNDQDLNEAVFNLWKVGGAPSHILLLNLLKYKASYDLSDANLTEIVSFLTKFFLRRNLTDEPPTRDLIRIFIDLVTKINGLTSNEVVEKIKSTLTKSTSSLNLLIECLCGQIYENNTDATRFILSYLCAQHLNKNETKGPWEKKDGKLIWTIEHIFPQTPKVSNEWVQMIANGDLDLAKSYLDTHLHLLGNLTLSGNNSNLGTRPFIQKRDYVVDGAKMGYNNGLWLNEDLVSAESWTIDAIETRTVKLVKEAISQFKFADEECKLTDEELKSIIHRINGIE